MGAAAGKATVWTTPAEDRLAAAELVIAERRRSSDGSRASRRRIWDAQPTCINETLLAAVDEIVLLKEIQAFPAASAASHPIEGALRAAMGCLMEDFLGLRVWDASQLEGMRGLRFAADKLSVSMEAWATPSFSQAFLTGGSTASTVRSTITGELSLGTMDELYESFDGEIPDELNLICLASLPVLHEISLRVIRAGYTKELLHAFSNAPCDVLDRFLSILQVGCCVETDPVISYENAERWTAEDMIRRWILATRLVMKALVAMQWLLHAQSSSAFDRFKDEYLLAIAKRSTSVLLRFADGFATTHSPEKLICVLEMYEVLDSVVVDGLMVVFAGQRAAKLISGQAEAILAKLARALRDMIRGLFTKIRTGGGATLDQSRTTRGVGAGVHPLTRYTMNCVQSLALHRTALDVILASTSGEQAGGAIEGVSSSRALVSEIITCLGSALSGASVGGGGRQQLFLANNISFVLKHAEDVLGDEWAALRRNRVEQHVRGYVECSWAPVVASLEAGNGKHPAKILAKFNSAVEKAYDGNAGYEVPDPELRAVLRKAVKEKVVRAYGAWLLKHLKLERSARYTVESLEGLLSELFEGGAEDGRTS